MLNAWLKLVAVVAALLLPQTGDDVGAGLSPGLDVAPGVRHYTLTEPALLDPPAPISIHLLRLDLNQVELTTDLALGDRQGRATVLSAALRRRAIAGVNAGFFNLNNGDPIGPLRVDGELVSDGSLGRGAVALADDPRGRGAWLFARASVSVAAVVDRGGRSVAVDGIDTTRSIGALMVYTPRYGPTSDTAPTGIEWVLRHGPGAVGTTYAVAERRWHVGKTPIPKDGAVLSYGGLLPPAPLDALAPGDKVTLRETWAAAGGDAADRWRLASDVVSGAGLLRHHGADVTDWQSEHLSPTFYGRHPRTMLGIDRAGYAWLVTVDGRQPDASNGMTLIELQKLARRLGLTDALNLDGGGSTTMVILGNVVNHPSDPTGARTVSDVLLVVPRPHRPSAR